MPPIDPVTVTPQQAAAAMLARAHRELDASEAERVRVRSALPQAVHLLRERYQVHRIWLFGTLAWGGWHAQSDVDLAVEGLGAEHSSNAWLDLERLFMRDVDLVRIERLQGSFRDRIVSEGEELS